MGGIGSAVTMGMFDCMEELGITFPVIGSSNSNVVIEKLNSVSVFCSDY